MTNIAEKLRKEIIHTIPESILNEVIDHLKEEFGSCGKTDKKHGCRAANEGQVNLPYCSKCERVMKLLLKLGRTRGKK